MTTVIDGSTGVSKVQDGSIVQADLASGVVGKGPAFKATRLTNQTGIVSATRTKVQLPIKDFDTASAFDNVTNHRFQPTIAGYYQFSGGVYFVGTALTTVIVAISKNGADVESAFITAPATGDQKIYVIGLTYLNGTTDYVELFATVTHGGAASFGAGSMLSGVLVRAA